MKELELGQDLAKGLISVHPTKTAELPFSSTALRKRCICTRTILVSRI